MIVADFRMVSQYTIQPGSEAFIRKLSTMIYCSHLSLLTIIEICFAHYGIDTSRWILFLLCLTSASSLSIFLLWLEDKWKIKILKYAH